MLRGWDFIQRGCWRPLCYLIRTIIATYMMTSSNGNIFHVTGPLCGECKRTFEINTRLASVTMVFSRRLPLLWNFHPHCCPIDGDIPPWRIFVPFPLAFLHECFTPWWRHQMETFSVLLALCAGNSPITGEFPAQRPVTRSFDVSFDRAWINCWVNNPETSDLRRYRVHYDVTIRNLSQMYML